MTNEAIADRHAIATPGRTSGQIRAWRLAGIWAALLSLRAGTDARRQTNRSADAGAVRVGKDVTSEQKSLLWIDWGRHLRSETLARRLGVGLEEICYDGGRLWRYARSVRRTVAIIQRRRPEVVIATNPSIVLGFTLLFLRRWYRFKLVSDAHYLGVTAVNESWLLQRLLDFHNARVDLVIVTNESQARFLSGLGARPYVCQDPLPDLPPARQPGVPPGERFALLICSFNADEPYEAVFEAFSSLRDEGITLFVTGNYRKAKIDLSRFPWVRLLGFLPTADYYEYLRSAGVVMDLTIREDCLVCGAYEALAAERPLIVSRTVALGEYFGDAVVFTDNTSAAIRESVLSAFARHDELVRRTKDWVALNHPYMDQKIASLRGLLVASSGRDR